MSRPLSPLALAAVVSLLATAAATRADSITVRASVRLPATATSVRLRDVATLEGPGAQAFADLEVAERADPGSVLRVELGEIRRRLEDAGAGWGTLHLNGQSVVVRPGRGTGSMAPLAMAGASVEAEPTPRAPRHEPQRADAADLVALPTLRGEIARRVADGLRVAPDDLRLTFDTADAAVLDLDRTGRRFEIQPLGSWASDRLDIVVRVWVDGRVRARHTVTVHPARRTTVAVARRDLPRGTTIDDTAVVAKTTWLQPARAALAVAPGDAAGRVTDRALREGDMLRVRHVARRTLIRRGDPVIVRCLVGGVVITLQAEARGEGAEGDRVEFRKVGERETFTAEVAGPGEAVLDLSRRSSGGSR
ncbi:MAG: flagellar basal body P-ring formation chaperone FlgA [Planctomycetota bacterium]|jgi:flagella basal body P-ring formation protein FlgA